MPTPQIKAVDVLARAAKFYQLMREIADKTADLDDNAPDHVLGPQLADLHSEFMIRWVEEIYPSRQDFETDLTTLAWLAAHGGSGEIPFPQRLN